MTHFPEVTYLQSDPFSNWAISNWVIWNDLIFEVIDPEVSHFRTGPLFQSDQDPKWKI